MEAKGTKKAKEAMGLETENMSFMEQFAGQGIENIGANETNVAYLSLVHPDSQYCDELNPAGTWRNSATGRNYGNLVKVIPLAFRTIWSERDSEPPFNTVGRYDPNSIKVEIKQPPKGKRGYPKMYNPETGNEIKELYVYAVVLPEYPEDGILYFNPTVSSMRTCKSWNGMLKGQILPNGAQAPIFAFQWNLGAELIPNPQKPSNQIAVFSKVIKDSFTLKEMFEEIVQPKLAGVSRAVLQITSNLPEDEELDADA